MHGLPVLLRVTRPGPDPGAALRRGGRRRPGRPRQWRRPTAGPTPHPRPDLSRVRAEAAELVRRSRYSEAADVLSAALDPAVWTLGAAARRRGEPATRPCERPVRPRALPHRAVPLRAAGDDAADADVALRAGGRRRRARPSSATWPVRSGCSAWSCTTPGALRRRRPAGRSSVVRSICSTDL